MAERVIPAYLQRCAEQLFPTDAFKTATALTCLLVEMLRCARLAACLSLKGIPEQALAVLRGALEQIGVYMHVWNRPEKYAAIDDPDSVEIRQSIS